MAVTAPDIRGSEFDVAINPGVWMTDPHPELLRPRLREVAALGYRAVVVVLRDPSTMDVGPIASELADAGLAAVGCSNQTADEDVSSDDPEVRARGLARLRRAVDLSVLLGADQLTGCVYGAWGRATGPVSDARFERTARLVGEVAEESAQRGVRLTCEIVNRYETSMITTARRGMEFAELSGSASLGLHLDVFHMNIEEDDLVAAVREAMPRLAYLELGQNHRGELSAGHVPLSAFLCGVLGAGYRGRFGLEAFSASSLRPAHAASLAVWRDVLDPQTRIAADALRLLGEASAAVRDSDPDRGSPNDD